MRLLLIFISTLLTVTAADRDPAKVLQRASIKARVRAATLPNYTCVQTVTRDYYKPASIPAVRSCAAILKARANAAPASHLQLTLTDRLRLDVTLADRGELYSWAGASKFEDAGIESIVHQGPISTGTFGALLAVVMAQDPASFQYRGVTNQNGRSLMEYAFEEPKKDSRYKVKTRDSWVYTAYSGSVAIDPESNEVVRLSVATAELPPETESCQTVSEMEYAMVRIGDAEFPLPQLGVQQFIDLNGEEARNTTTLSSCREYRGESTISFFTSPDAEGDRGGKGGETRTMEVPSGLPFTFELIAPIAADTAAGGDSFSGRLVGALRVKGKTIAPAHAPVEGRLLRVEMRRTAPFGAILVLRMRTVEIGGVKVPIAAVQPPSRVPAAARRGTPILLPYPWEQNSGIFPLPGAHAVMKAGTRSDWVTR